MLHAVENNDLERLRVFGHQLKGNGGSFGFDQISSLGEVIETAAIGNDRNSIKSSITELSTFLDRVSFQIA